MIASLSRRSMVPFGIVVLAVSIPTAMSHAGPSCSSASAAGCAMQSAYAVTAAADPGTPAPDQETSQETPRGWLGILAQNITPDLRESMDLASNDGALVAQVVDGSPAEKAGLEEGDVILELNGTAMKDAAALRTMAASLTPGATVKARVAHDGRVRDVSLEVGTRPAEPRESRMFRMGPGMAGLPEPPDVPGMNWFEVAAGPRLGIRVEGLDEDLASYFDVSKDAGVLVVEVMPDSPAKSAGVKAGDIIQKVDGKKVVSPSELVSAIRDADEGDEVRLSIHRKGRDMTITATPEEGRHAGGPDVMMFSPRGWGRHDGGSRHDRDEIEALRDEVRELREEIRKQRN